MIQTLPIHMIATGDRHRVDMGDVEALAESIQRVGLLHPVVVTADHVLIAGGRRIEACKRLGWSAVPVRVAVNITDAHTALEAERDENTCREPMRPSEFVALGKALKALEAPKAAERKAAGAVEGGLTAGRGRPNSSDVKDDKAIRRPPRTDDIVGAALGIAGSTFHRAEKVVDASEDETLPADVRAAAQEIREEMDATGKVNPAFNKLAEALGRKPTNAVPPEQRMEPYRPETDRQRQFAEAQKKRLVIALSGVSGTCRGIQEIDLRKAVAVCTDEEIRQWADMAGDCARELRKLRSNLNGSASNE